VTSESNPPVGPCARISSDSHTSLLRSERGPRSRGRYFGRVLSPVC
jgi:hypothetical protein